MAPESEARFESKSYGFRPDRGCHDAIEAIFTAVGGKNPHRRRSLDAAVAAVFDCIDHAHPLRQLGAFPEEQIKQRLNLGVVERQQLTSTEARAPQGGLVSPTLLNVALHGLDEAAGGWYLPDGMRHAGRLEPAPPW
ncbi:reverse transcriptase domain-containing protein [Streptomyces sp. NBC_01483]|uniref:reverse transcriptase domain-containing protein n=1 Tax=Streptomyces sp. NBC_01483 TaxID=2903883 RepID=UPI002E381F9A|nr:reverse transcriptase domain-containing protein [Streptomyces sp. NBC_01483]